MLYRLGAATVTRSGLAASILPAPARAQPVAGDPRILRAGPILKRMTAVAARDAQLLGFDGSTPGPLLRVKKGERLAIRLENGLDTPSSIHWYGVRGSNAMDGTAGLTQAAVPPGGSFDYVLSPPDAGIFWYHPLVKGRTAEQVDRGLAGMLIVDEAEPVAVDQDFAVIIDDWRLDPDGQATLGYLSASDVSQGGRLGNFLTVNGLAAPQLMAFAPGSRLRLRFLNVANARSCPLKFENLQARVLAIDGQPCDPFDPLRRTVIMAPGSRFDILIDLAREDLADGKIGISVGTLVLPLLTLKASGPALAPRPPIRPLPGNDLPPSIRLQDATRVDLAITGGASRVEGSATQMSAEAIVRYPDVRKIWMLNGVALDGFRGRPLFTVKRGTPVVLALFNRTAFAHVIHVHGHNFRLLHPFDDGWEPYFLDTLYLPEKQTSRISFIADNVGRWAIRSSILEHFDGGVATWFEVT